MTVDAYIGKRFAGMILASCILGVAYFTGSNEKFSALATTLGLIYGVFVGGQSYTDVKEKP